jgi:hypothetical protein
MKIKLLGAMALVAAACSGCVSDSGKASPYKALTQEEVLKRQGSPSSVTRDVSGNEVWIYARADGTSLVMTFNRDGTVRGQSIWQDKNR